MRAKMRRVTGNGAGCYLVAGPDWKGRFGSAAGSRDFYKGNWALRAAAAKLGIYGNSETEAVYPFTRHDSNGIVLDGSR